MSLVSILIPTYNQPEFFRRTLISALNQDYPDIEILIGDDSTDDRVKNVVDEFLSRPQRFPIRYFRNTDKSDSKSISNHDNLLKNARGEYISFLYHDDLIEPTKISKVMLMFESEYGKDIALVTSNRWIIDESDTIIDKYGIDFEGILGRHSRTLSSEEFASICLLTKNNLFGEPSAVVFKKDDLLDSETGEYKLGIFLGKKFLAHFDFPMWLELCRKRDSLVVFINEPLTSFRRHSSQNSADPWLNFCLITEWADILAHAFLNDTFIHDTQSLDQGCQLWLKYVREFFTLHRSKVENTPAILENLDILTQMAQTVEENNFSKFLQLAVKKKPWETV